MLPCQWRSRLYRHKSYCCLHHDTISVHDNNRTEEVANTNNIMMGLQCPNGIYNYTESQSGLITKMVCGNVFFVGFLTFSI